MDKNKNIKFKIEIGTKEDIEQLDRLYNDLNEYLEKGINYPGWLKGVYPIRETAEMGIAENNLFVLKVKSDIAGSIILNHKPENAYNEVIWSINANKDEVIVIHTLAVHPHFMKYGVAQKLMDFAELYALQENAKSIRLDVAVQNAPAISLYEKCGYDYIGTVDLGLPYEHLKWFKLYELVL